MICASEAVLLTRMDGEMSAAAKQLASRLQGVVFAQQYLMLDYDCPAGAAGQGHRHHPRSGVADRRAAGRPALAWRCGRWCGATRSTR